MRLLVRQYRQPATNWGLHMATMPTASALAPAPYCYVTPALQQAHNEECYTLAAAIDDIIIKGKRRYITSEGRVTGLPVLDVLDALANAGWVTPTTGEQLVIWAKTQGFKYSTGIGHFYTTDDILYI